MHPHKVDITSNHFLAALQLHPPTAQRAARPRTLRPTLQHISGLLSCEDAQHPRGLRAAQRARGPRQHRGAANAQAEVRARQQQECAWLIQAHDTRALVCGLRRVRG